MQKRKTFTVIAILLAVLVLGVGYALIADVELSLNGTANIMANSDFSVVYDTEFTPAVSSMGTVTDGTNTQTIVDGAVTNTSTATMTVWLDSTNKSAYAIYKIDNESTDLAADLSASVTPMNGTGASYFDEPAYEFCADSTCSTPLSGNLEPEQSAYMKVTVGLARAPLSDITGETFSITITAAPREAA